MNSIPVLGAVALIAFSASFLGLRIFRRAAVTVNLIDVAGTLKNHQGEVPLVGGLAILVGYISSLVSYPTLFLENGTFLLVSVLLVVVGALDDRFGLSPLMRLAVQFVVALAAVFGAGLSVETIGNPFFMGDVHMSWLAIPFAVLVFVGSINAWNMIDGIDGLAAVLAFIGLFCLLTVSSGASASLQASLLALLCAIGAFFVFNLPVRRMRSQRTFLGDAGSMFLGLAVVWHALSLSQGSDAVLSPITALWFVALPVFDVITTTLRRILQGKSPLAGDRMHLHHLLQDYGFTPRQTLFVMTGLGLAGGIIGLAGHFLDIDDGYVFVLFAMSGVAYARGVRNLANRSGKLRVAGSAQRR